MSAGILRSGKYAAAQTSRAAATALSEPLIPAAAAKMGRRTESSYSSFADDEVSEYSGNEDEELVPEALTGKDLFSTIAVSLLVTGGMAASASAMIAVPGVAVLLMGSICIVNAPTVALKHLRVAKSSGLRQSLSELRKHVEFLRDEVDFIKDSVDDLQAEADILVELEQDLQAIADRQDTNVKELVDLVNKNEEALEQMKANMRQTFVAAMTSVVMRSDTDGDMMINIKELPLLSLRLQIQLDPYGIKLDPTKFESMIRENNSIEHVMRFCGEMLFWEEENSSISDDDSVDSELTFDFESFCKTLDEEGEGGETKMSKKERFTMVSVGEQFSKGSVEVARGKRMTLMANESAKEGRRRTILKEVKRRQTVMKRRGASRHLQEGNDNTQSPGRRNSRMSFASGLVIIQGTSTEL